MIIRALGNLNASGRVCNLDAEGRRNSRFLCYEKKNGERLQLAGMTNEHAKPNRVDRADLESNSRLYQGVTRLQELLRGNDGSPAEGDGR